ncbi:hypothetical protein JOC36_001314 [Weissella uvarum]|uniref:competence protein CoiA family protein n=1 Tax=Weissella uvarum TaxID=1479233 RepID=UPI0019601EC3|nr:hypothetical protein [Weissella uvarum]MCM0595884.1 hypothetical protein [Weissella uvarum]
METIEHRDGKRAVFEFFKHYFEHVELEIYVTDLQQRPDILIFLPNQQLIAVELQCAKLNFETLKTRCIGYQKAQIKCMWLLRRNYLKEIPYAFLQFDGVSLFVWYWQSNHPVKMFFDGVHPLVRSQQRLWNSARLRYLIQRGIIKRQAPYYDLQCQIYQQEGNLRQLPDCCVPQVYYPIGPKQPYWYVLYVLYLRLKRGPQSNQLLYQALYVLPWHQSVYFSHNQWCQLVLTAILECWQMQGVIRQQASKWALVSNN